MITETETKMETEPMPNESEPMDEIKIEPPQEETSYDAQEYATPSSCERCAEYLSEISSYIVGESAPLTTAGWVWVNFAMLIPPLNLILLFLWAGGGTERVNLKNYARGILLTAVLLALIFLITVTVLDLSGVDIGWWRWRGQ